DAAGAPRHLVAGPDVLANLDAIAGVLEHGARGDLALGDGHIVLPTKDDRYVGDRVSRHWRSPCGAVRLGTRAGLVQHQPAPISDSSVGGHYLQAAPAVRGAVDAVQYIWIARRQSAGRRLDTLHRGRYDSRARRSRPSRATARNAHGPAQGIMAMT